VSDFLNECDCERYLHVQGLCTCVCVCTYIYIYMCVYVLFVCICPCECVYTLSKHIPNFAIYNDVDANGPVVT
jgi:hypothetical protein